MEKHNIQKLILIKLLKSGEGLRYRDMKPSDIENDLYNYHLQYLVKNNLIKKEDENYFLTDTGKHYVEDIIPLDPIGQTSDLFRVNILACLIRKNGDKLEILNQYRKRHPYYGDTGIIGGTVRKGELIHEAAKRKFFEETGLTADFKFSGVVRKLRYKSKDELFTDILFHVCFSDSYTGELIESNDFGDNFWLDIDKSIEMEEKSAMGSRALVYVLKLLKSKDFREIEQFYFEEEKILQSF